MERLSKCLPLTCSKTFRTFVLMMGFMVSSGTNDELYKRFPMPQRNGSFWSPNFPSPYPPNIRYEWVFPYSEDVVRVHFDEMDLYRCYTRDDNQDCLMYDHVLVQHLWPAYCNWYKPAGPLSFGPRVQTTITFRSRPNTKEACRGKGFKATFKRYPQIHSVMPSAMTTTMTTLKRGSKEVNNEDMKVIIIIGIIIIVLSVVAVIVCCCYRRVKNRRNRQRQRSENQNRERASSYSAIPQRGAQTESTELTGQVQHPHPEPSFTRARGPPPTYDTVSNIDSIGEFESPPSYESVLRENLGTNSRQSSQRSHRSRDVTHPQRTRPDGHNRRDVSREETTNSARTMIPANTRQSRDSQSRRVPHSRNQRHEVDEQGIANRESATSLSRDATRVPRTHGIQNQDVDSESTNERGSLAGEQTTDRPLSRNTNGTPENQHQRMSNSAITSGVSQGDSQENEIAESSRSRRASDRQVFV